MNLTAPKPLELMHRFHFHLYKKFKLAITRITTCSSTTRKHRLIPDLVLEDAGAGILK